MWNQGTLQNILGFGINNIYCYVPDAMQISSSSDSPCDMHRLDVRDFGSLLDIWLGDISYYAPLLIFKIPAFPVLHVSSALWMAVGNVLLQSALIIVAGKQLAQAF